MLVSVALACQAPAVVLEKFKKTASPTAPTDGFSATLSETESTPGPSTKDSSPLAPVETFFPTPTESAINPGYPAPDLPQLDQDLTSTSLAQTTTPSPTDEYSYPGIQTGIPDQAQPSETHWIGTVLIPQVFSGSQSTVTITSTATTITPTSSRTASVPPTTVTLPASVQATSTASLENPNTYPGPVSGTATRTPPTTQTLTMQATTPVNDQQTGFTPSVIISPTFPTLTPTRTPFMTRTPTLTPAPTITRTPPPAPAWISSKLKATDPRTVRLAAGVPQLVMFFAYWSGPSQAIAPTVHSLERLYQGQVKFSYLDTDNPANTIYERQLFFRQEPHFFLLDAQGKVMKQWVGYASFEQMRQWIEAALK